MKRKFPGALCLGLSLALSATAVYSQDYPNKLIRLVVPFPPGGGTDIVARTVAAKLGETLHTSVVVDNRPGAGGTIGTEIVSRAEPDGYTLALVSGSHVINPSIYPKLPYDTLRDFAPVTLLVSAPAVLVVNKSLPVDTVQDLIKLAKSKPGTLFFASAGVGTPPHLAGELFKTMAGIDIVHVPYKGNAQVLTDTVSGQVSFTFPTLPSAMPYVKNGTLRALGVTSTHRSPSAPEVPTIAESGVPGYDATSWYGVVAPAGTPPEIVDKLHDAMAGSLKQPDVRKVLTDLGLEAVGNSPAEFSAQIKTEIEKWATVVKRNHLTF
ncbi:tripartite tricarboxylate transporter substrate binding protein [Pigmentiphaga soli]